MRMMKNNRNETIMVIGIDHGYGNMKTATRCFPSGVARYDKEPIFQNNLLVYNTSRSRTNKWIRRCIRWILPTSESSLRRNRQKRWRKCRQSGTSCRREIRR